MSPKPLPRVFSLLATERSRAADEALIESLPHVDFDVRAASLELLSKFGRPESLSVLISRLPFYDTDLQDAVLARIGSFHSGVRLAIESTSFEDRAAAIEAIAAAQDDKSAYLLGDALRSTCPRTRELSAKAVHRMVAAHLERRDAGVAPDQAAAFASITKRLVELLRAVVGHWELHLHTQALEAALWMFDETEDAFSKKFEQPHTKILHALRDILEGASDRRLAGFAVRALSIADLRASAVVAISKARHRDFISSIIDEGWLLCDPTIEHGCRYIRESKAVEGWLVETAGIDRRRAASAARWIGTAGGSRERTLTAFSELIGVNSDPLRRAVVWRLVDDESDGATELLGKLSSRYRDGVGEIAEREFRRRRPAPVGRAKGSTASRGDLRPAFAHAFERYFAEFERLRPDERVSLGRQLVEVVPDLAARMNSKLDSSNPLDRATALRLVATLGLTDTLRERIYRCVNDADAIVRSAAVAVLECDGSTTSRRLIRNAIHDCDPRVQATAVESLGRIDPKEHARSIDGKLDSKDNRVRANAIKALIELRLDKASKALLDMLAHSSYAHRLSALWVVERLGMRDMMERVAAMGRSDDDHRVRTRARRVIRQLLDGPIVPDTGGHAAGKEGAA